MDFNNWLISETKTDEEIKDIIKNYIECLNSTLNYYSSHKLYGLKGYLLDRIKNWEFNFNNSLTNNVSIINSDIENIWRWYNSNNKNKFLINKLNSCAENARKQLMSLLHSSELPVAHDFSIEKNTESEVISYWWEKIHQLLIGIRLYIHEFTNDDLWIRIYQLALYDINKSYKELANIIKIILQWISDYKNSVFFTRIKRPMPENAIGYPSCERHRILSLKYFNALDKLLQNISSQVWYNQYLKEWANFGFERVNKYQPPKDEHVGPMPKHHMEYVINELKKVNVGMHEGRDSLYNGVEWGNGPGTISVNISPFGGMRASIRKKTINLEGETVWICKKIDQIEDYEDPEKIISQITEDARKIDKEGIPAPDKEFKKLEQLVIDSAAAITTRSKQRVLMYEGIKVITPYKEYIIHFGLTGMGRQARGQRRVDQFQVHFKYNEHTGIIKVVGNEVGDKIDQCRWIIENSEFIEFFVPGQPKQEIISAVVEAVSSVY